MHATTPAEPSSHQVCMYEASRVSHHLITHMLVILFTQVSTRALDPIEAQLEAWWAEYQGIAGGAIKITSMLISASGLPGAGALSAAMDKVVIAAAGATENRESCKRLAFLVCTCDIALSDAGSKNGLCASGHAEELLASLKEAMEEAAAVAKEFGQKRGMVMRLVKYSSDADAFKQVHNRLGDCMKVGKCMSCRSRSSLIALLSRLQTFTFCLCAKLLGEVSSQLDMFGQRVTFIEERMGRVEQLVDSAEWFRKQPPQALKKYLKDWWFDKIGGEMEVDNDTFYHKLMDTMQSQG